MKNILASMCYIDTGSHYLMLKRNKKENDVHEGLTISVGGKIEAGETPEEAIIREVKEETGLDISKPKLRGIITFPKFDGENNWYTYLFTATNFSGNMLENCPEGDLIWVDKEDIKNRKIHTWEGDFIFLDWLIDEKPFFSAKFEYVNKELKDYSVEFY
ncbi:MAG: 8-oxo-dGTP diphosphatase [Gemella sp.]|nr:8-oxo-dGTP diphosphatase [Gemella sp.]